MGNVFPGTVFIGAVLAIAWFAGFCIGRWYNTSDDITLKDVLSWSGEPRKVLKRAYHVALQLQDEIVGSGALKIKELENGDYEVCLKVVL